MPEYPPSTTLSDGGGQRDREPIMPIDTAVLTTLSLSGLGAVVWLIRLEGRVNTGESKHANLQERHDELHADVRYIRQRIDQALNGRHP